MLNTDLFYTLVNLDKSGGFVLSLFNINELRSWKNSNMSLQGKVVLSLLGKVVLMIDEIRFLLYVNLNSRVSIMTLCI